MHSLVDVTRDGHTVMSRVEEVNEGLRAQEREQSEKAAQRR